MFYPSARSHTRKQWWVWVRRVRVELWRRSHCDPLLPYGVWVVRRDVNGQVVSQHRRVEVDAMRRPNVSDSGGDHPLSEADPKSWKGFPNIRGFFLDTTYEGGTSPRQPGLLIVSVNPTGWTWTLKDPAAGTQLRISGPTWDDVQLLAEGLLADPRAPWVLDPYAQKKRPTSRPKLP